MRWSVAEGTRRRLRALDRAEGAKKMNALTRFDGLCGVARLCLKPYVGATRIRRASAALSDASDIPVSHRDRVYAAEQFSNTVSVIDPADNRVLGVIRLGDTIPTKWERSYRTACIVQSKSRRGGNRRRRRVDPPVNTGHGRATASLLNYCVWDGRASRRARTGSGTVTNDLQSLRLHLTSGRA